MKTLQVTFVAALLSASSAYAASPDWTAAIGTGAVSNSSPTATVTTTAGQPASPSWTAAIGTGHATDAETQPSAKAPLSNVIVAGPHWTAKIGTGTI